MISRLTLPTITAILLAGLLCALGVSSCSEQCDDVLCSPAPPPLEVIVADSITIDTIKTIYDEILGDSVQQAVTIVRQERTGNAIVRLLQVNGGDTVAFDTLTYTENPRTYYPNAPRSLPTTPFMIVAAIGSRADTVLNAQLQTTEGCCSYNVVGRFIIQLPATP